jgi:hypothetical protein
VALQYLAKGQLLTHAPQQDDLFTGSKGTYPFWAKQPFASRRYYDDHIIAADKAKPKQNNHVHQ